jgi:hypothetical protein
MLQNEHASSVKFDPAGVLFTTRPVCTLKPEHNSRGERKNMASIIVSFKSEKEAQEVIQRLSQADLGEVRTRILDSSEDLSYQKDENTSPIVSPELGSVEVRPSERPVMPESMHDDVDDEVTANIPTTGSATQGVQVMIEVNDEFENVVREILSERRGTTGVERADE